MEVIDSKPKVAEKMMKKKSKKCAPKESRTRVVINHVDCKYSIVPLAAKELGWERSVQVMGMQSLLDWDVYWTDTGQGIENFVCLAKSFQRINHFPGMVSIYRKHNLSTTLSSMAETDSMAFDFFPKTWNLPEEYDSIVGQYKDQDCCFIVKPVAGSQGKGIYLAIGVAGINNKKTAVVQSYISRPLLIDGFKFDLRIYALVVSCDPLRILVYREGLVRLCTAPYSAPTESNIDCSYMHLTNYAMNKTNVDFVQNNEDNEEGSSKRSLSWLWQWLESQGHSKALVWRGICDIIVKTLISTQPSLARAYNSCRIDKDNRSPFTCFEVLGFDILLSEDLKPYLLEVNHTPSFRTDSALDMRVKRALIRNCLEIINTRPIDRKNYFALAAHVRTYGSTYDKIKPRVVDDPESEVFKYWTAYLSNEKKVQGEFDVVFPADESRGQPTFGSQAFYEHLLEVADALFIASCGAVDGYSHQRSLALSRCQLSACQWTSSPHAASRPQQQQQQQQMRRGSYNLTSGGGSRSSSAASHTRRAVSASSRSRTASVSSSPGFNSRAGPRESQPGDYHDSQLRRMDAVKLGSSGAAAEGQTDSESSGSTSEAAAGKSAGLSSLPLSLLRDRLACTSSPNVPVPYTNDVSMPPISPLHSPREATIPADEFDRYQPNPTKSAAFTNDGNGSHQGRPIIARSSQASDAKCVAPTAPASSVPSSSGSKGRRQQQASITIAVLEQIQPAYHHQSPKPQCFNFPDLQQTSPVRGVRDSTSASPLFKKDSSSSSSSSSFPSAATSKKTSSKVGFGSGASASRSDTRKFLVQNKHENSANTGGAASSINEQLSLSPPRSGYGLQRHGSPHWRDPSSALQGESLTDGREPSGTSVRATAGSQDKLGCESGDGGASGLSQQEGDHGTAPGIVYAHGPEALVAVGGVKSALHIRRTLADNAARLFHRVLWAEDDAAVSSRQAAGESLSDDAAVPAGPGTAAAFIDGYFSGGE